MPRPLDGRVAVVTGAGRGLGRAIALAFAREGVAVACVARSHSEVRAAAREISALGGRAISISADIANPKTPTQISYEVERELGHIGILVNNAAIVAPLGPTSLVDMADWSEAIQVNLVGPARLTNAVLPGMISQAWGRIINVSSGVVAGPSFMSGGNAYVTSKAALEAHTVNLAAELAGTGVTANVLRPGVMDTGMQRWIREQPADRLGAGLHARYVALYELGSLADPSLAAQFAVSIAVSDASGRIVEADAAESRSN